MMNQPYVGSGPNSEALCKLMVTNLPFSVSQQQIQRLFMDAGPCKVTIRKYERRPDPVGRSYPSPLPPSSSTTLLTTVLRRNEPE